MLDFHWHHYKNVQVIIALDGLRLYNWDDFKALNTTKSQNRSFDLLISIPNSKFMFGQEENAWHLVS